MGAADFVPKNVINGINGITMVFVIVALQLCMGVWLVVPKGVASEKGQNQQNSTNSKNSILCNEILAEFTQFQKICE